MLFCLSLLLIPLVSAIQSIETTGDRDTLFVGLFGILSLVLFLGLGLFYAARKGDLSWLQSFKRD